MFKLESLCSGDIVKSYNIYNLWEFIIKHPEFKYQFYIEFNPITTDEFLKYHLQETKNYENYQQLFSILKTTITSKEILKKWQKNERA